MLTDQGLSPLASPGERGAAAVVFGSSWRAELDASSEQHECHTSCKEHLAKAFSVARSKQPILPSAQKLSSSISFWLMTS